MMIDDRKTLDAYYLSIKNRIKDYIVARNTIPLLPLEQQSSATMFADQIEDFISKSLIPHVRELTEKADDYFFIGKSEHGCVAGSALIFDYYYFKNAVDGRDYFRDVSMITTMKPEKVLPVLQNTAKALDKLRQCNSLQEMLDNGLTALRGTRGLINYFGENGWFRVEENGNGKDYCVRVNGDHYTKDTNILNYYLDNWESNDKVTIENMPSVGVDAGRIRIDGMCSSARLVVHLSEQRVPADSAKSVDVPINEDGTKTIYMPYGFDLGAKSAKECLVPFKMPPNEFPKFVANCNRAIQEYRKEHSQEQTQVQTKSNIERNVKNEH